MNIEGLHNGTGYLLVDKPTGCTSHDVVAVVRKMAGVKKVGHAGTLDPLATGLLIVLVGRSWTKRQSEFLHLDKSYRCTMILGTTTDTYDTDGVVLQKKSAAALTNSEISEGLLSFVGQYDQQVPPFAAVKVGGKKLYELARAGVLKDQDQFTLPVRRVSIPSITDVVITQDSGQVSCSFTVHVSSGTYIRSLAHDVGQKLGVGACVSVLRRLSIGQHFLTSAVLCPFFRKK